MNLSSFKTRSITALIFGTVLISGIFFSVKTAIIIFGAVCLLCAFEYTKIIRQNLKDSLFNTTFVAGIALYALAFIPDINQYFEIALYISVAFFILFFISMITGKAFFSQSQISPVYSLIYIGLPFYLLNANFFQQGHYEPWLLMSIFICIWLSDTGAYLIGSWLGRTPLFKRVSPNKTWEGTIGGLFVVLLGVYIMHQIQLFPEMTLMQWLGFGLTIFVSGTIGDLYESSIKRKFKIKDSGNLLPGHGGFLDRFDSFIFTIPFIILYLELI
jgi:phosphatidate cytidylyltransferase